MPRRRKSSTTEFTAELGLAGMHAFVTLWYRIPMLATAGKPDSEMSRMVGEKTAAWIEGAWDAQVEALRIAGKAATGQLRPSDFAGAPTQIAAAGLRPAFRRVKATSRRLRRRGQS